MTRATNAGAQGNAGVFATCRRGGLTHEEIREIEAHRAKDRPTPWQALAIRYGRSEIEIRALFQTKPANDVAPAWPLGACDAPSPLAEETTAELPGTRAKVDVFCSRYARREQLFHPGDAVDVVADEWEELPDGIDGVTSSCPGVSGGGWS